MSAQVFPITVTRQRRSPLRLPRWDAVIGQGDDFKIQMTVLNQEADTSPVDVSAALCQLAVYPERRDWIPPWYDYCASSFQPWPFSWPYITAPGYVWNGTAGLLNVQLPASQTLCLWGRFGMALQIDFGDGLQTVLEGVLGIERSSQMAATQRTFFVLDVSTLDGPHLLAAGVNSVNQPVDDFGFPIGPIEP